MRHFDSEVGIGMAAGDHDGRRGFLKATAFAVAVQLRRLPRDGPRRRPQSNAQGANQTLQGIWTDEIDTPLQAPRQYANQIFKSPGPATEHGQAAISAVVGTG